MASSSFCWANRLGLLWYCGSKSLKRFGLGFDGLDIVVRRRPAASW